MARFWTHYITEERYGDVLLKYAQVSLFPRTCLSTITTCYSCENMLEVVKAVCNLKNEILQPHLATTFDIGNNILLIESFLLVIYLSCSTQNEEKSFTKLVCLLAIFV